MKREFVVHEIYINQQADRKKAALELWRRANAAVQRGEGSVPCDVPFIAD
ncbi:MAG: hypothetical protein HFI90_04765 [Clostridia bacterium]|nr:hypothetical protein [Clostridia bacterium]